MEDGQSQRPIRWRGTDRISRFSDPAIRGRSARRRRIFRLMASMLAVTGAIVGMLVWLSPLPRPYLVPLWITQYGSPLVPFPAQAERDQFALLGEDLFPDRTESSYTYQEQAPLERNIAALATLTDREPLVVYLSAFAARDAEGKIALFAGDFDPDGPRGRLPLRAVLGALTQTPIRHKLLILDIQRPIADSRLGILADEVAARIEPELAAVPDPDRLVLCSCSPGQVSLAPEYLGRTLFGYYVQTGLGGWADGHNPAGQRDGKVSAFELAEYVARRVDRFAATSWNTRQTPRLLGTGADFALYAPPHGTPLPYPTVPPLAIRAPHAAPSSTAPPVAGQSNAASGSPASSSTSPAPAAVAPATAPPAAGKAPDSTTPAGPPSASNTAAASTPGNALAPGSSPAGGTSPAPATNPASTPTPTPPPTPPTTPPVGPTAPAVADGKLGQAETAAQSWIMSAGRAAAAAPAKAWRWIESFWETPPVPPIEFAYPDWLLEGWRQLDQWRDQKVYGTAPLVYRRLESTLLRAESRWRGGESVTRVQSDLKEALASLNGERDAYLNYPRPRAYSLAQAAQESGAPTNAALANALRQLLDQWLAETAGAKPEDAEKVATKLAADFRQRFATASDFEVAWHVFEVAVANPLPSRPFVRFLASLLSDRQAQAQFIELLLLARLGRLAELSTPEQWSPDAVHSALSNARGSEDTAAQPRTFRWLRGEYEQAASVLHDAEYFLFSPGYCQLSDVHSRMAEAARRIEVIEIVRRSLDRALATSDQALAVLPRYAAYLESPAADRVLWTKATRDARQLDLLLDPPGGDTDPDAASLRRTSEAIARATTPLESDLSSLLAPFQTENLVALSQRGEQPRIDFAALADMEAILRTPFPRADDRAALWRGLMACSGRAIRVSLALDQSEDADHRLTESGPTSYTAAIERFQNDRFDQGLARARAALALLDLAGLPPTQIGDMGQRIRDLDEGTPDWDKLAVLGTDLLGWWNRDLPARYAAESSFRAQARILAVADPLDPWSLSIDASRDPIYRARAAEDREVWTWKARFCRYMSHDSRDGAFFAAATRGFAPFADPLPPEIYPVMANSFAPADLASSQPRLPCSLDIVLYGPDAPVKVTNLRVATADSAWLDVDVDRSPIASLEAADPLPRSARVPLDIRIETDAAGLGVPIPRGLLVQLDVNGRTFHHLVTFPVPSPLEANRLQLLLSADPKAPSQPLADMRLRPLGTIEERFLYARNLTDEARKLQVELGPVGAPVGVAEVTLAAGQTQKVSFGTEVPKPGTDLPSFSGSIEARLVDGADKQTILARRVIEARVASPRDYVEVVDARFRPTNAQTGKPNRFSVVLRARAALDPPCAVELVLAPDRIPGLGAITEGTLKGPLPPPPQSLELFANQIQLSPAGDPQGTASVTVDGAPRAFSFDVSFARYGDATSPSLLTRPAVRLIFPRIANSSAPLTVSAEVDNAPLGASLDVRLGQPIGGVLSSEVSRRVQPARDERIGFSAKGPTGGLAFSATVRDWSISLDATGISGQRWLEAQVLDPAGNVVASAREYVMLDHLSPTGVRFLDLPRQAKKGEPLRVKASGFDAESGIAKVFFFVGKPADSKPPMNALSIDGQPIDAAKTVWSAILPLPAAAGPTDLSVGFTNTAGIVTYASRTIELVDKLPAKRGRVVGSVTEGSNRQPGLTVYLMDPKSKEKDHVVAKTTSTPQGTYQFDGLAAGSYFVFCEKPSTGRTALVGAEVTPGNVTTVDLALSLQKSPAPK